MWLGLQLSVGSVRARFSKNICILILVDACASAIGFYFLGYAFAFGDDAENPNKFIGMPRLLPLPCAKLESRCTTLRAMQLSVCLPRSDWPLDSCIGLEVQQFFEWFWTASQLSCCLGHPTQFSLLSAFQRAEGLPAGYLKSCPLVSMRACQQRGG